MRRILREDQAAAFENVRESVKNGHRCTMLQAPCGFGKTVVGAEMVDSALSRGRRVIFTVPAISLIDQTVDSFQRHGIEDIGVMQGNHPMTNPRKKLQICSVKTLCVRDIPKADVVFVDEAHRWYKMFGEWMSDPTWDHVPFIGMSATPGTKGLGNHYSNMVIAATTADMIDRGLLSPFRVFGPKSGLKPDLKNLRMLAGDWVKGDLAAEMSQRVLVADVVEHWLELAQDRPTLLFAVNRAHAKLLRDEFEFYGVRTGYIDQHTSRDQRAMIGKALNCGFIKVVINVDTCTTGIDWDVRCIILCRPMNSEMLYCQAIGRGLRTALGKDYCLILDHSTTTERLGFVTDIAFRELDNGIYSRTNRERVRKERSDLPRECPNCKFLKPSGALKCSNCGHEERKPSGVIHVVGELEEKTKNTKQWTIEEKQFWYSAFLQICDSRNAKTGWASHKFKDKFGHWPDGLSFERVTPSPEIANWVKSRDIRFAKRRVV